jgi:hypothetical protein
VRASGSRACQQRHNRSFRHTDSRTTGATCTTMNKGPFAHHLTLMEELKAATEAAHRRLESAPFFSALAGCHLPLRILRRSTPSHGSHSWRFGARARELC